MRSTGAPFHLTEDVVPLSELETNASGLVRKRHEMQESGRSVVLTEEGRPAAVLVTPEEFDELHERERVIAAVERGRADIRAGRVVDDEEFGREIDERYGPGE